MDVYYDKKFLEIYSKNFDVETDYIEVDTSFLCLNYPVIIEDDYIKNPYGYGGPWLIKGTWEDALHFMKNYTESKGVNHEDVKLHLFNNNKTIPGAEFNRKNVYLHVGQTIDDVWKNIDKYKRKNIRRGKARGLKFEKTNDTDTFKKIYDGRMKTVNARDFYFFPISYYDDLIRNNLASIYEVKLDDKTILSSMLLHSGKRIVYDYLRGNIEGFNNYYPTDFVIYKLAEETHKLAYDYYVLGGGKSPMDELFRFKSKFSNTTKDFYTYKKDW